jgi:hypothetical protein
VSAYRNALKAAHAASAQTTAALEALLHLGGDAVGAAAPMTCVMDRLMVAIRRTNELCDLVQEAACEATGTHHG